DGIRDFHVTGVQTCALPISRLEQARRRHGAAYEVAKHITSEGHLKAEIVTLAAAGLESSNPQGKIWPKVSHAPRAFRIDRVTTRSEERRVGKECSAWRGREQ